MKTHRSNESMFEVRLVAQFYEENTTLLGRACLTTNADDEGAYAHIQTLKQILVILVAAYVVYLNIQNKL